MKNKNFIKSLILGISLISFSVLPVSQVFAQDDDNEEEEESEAAAINRAHMESTRLKAQFFALQKNFLAAIERGETDKSQKILFKMMEIQDKFFKINMWLAMHGEKTDLPPAGAMPTFPSYSPGYAPNNSASQEYLENQRAKAAAARERAQQSMDDARIRLGTPHYGG